MTRGRSRAVTALLAATLAIAVGSCSPAPSPSPSPTPSPTPTPAATASPTPLPSPAEATPAPAPEGTVPVAIPLAGLVLPVPAAWEQFDADALADEAVMADVAARYPGADRLLEAAEQMGGRATPALIALDPAAAGTDVTIAPNIAVLVAQPAVGGPLLDFVAGFIADGFAESFGATETGRDRVDTPIGEAVRLRFEIPADGGTPLAATAWVIGAEEGTVLVTVIGPADQPPAADPDLLLNAATTLP